MNLDKRLLGLLRKERLVLLAVIFSGIIAGLVTVALAWVLSVIIDDVFIKNGNSDSVLPFFALFAALALAKAFFFWLSRERASELAGRLKIKLRKMLTSKLDELGPLYAYGEKSGELVNTSYKGIEALDAYFSAYIPQLFFSVAIPLTVLAVVFPFDILSGVVLLITAPIIPVFMVLIGQTAKSMTDRQWKTLSRMSAHFLDVLQGLTTLKIFGKSKSEAENIFRVSDLFRRKTMDVLKVAFLSALVLEMAATISTAVIAVEIGLRLMYGKMFFQPALFILILAPEFYQPMRQLGAKFHAGMEGVSAASRIYEIIEMPSAKKNVLLTDLALKKDAEIVFADVFFSYGKENEYAVRELNFVIPPGKKTALVGHSGAGKSTIASLLMKFAEPEKGNIFIGDIPLASIPEKKWLEYVSWLPQKPYLFHKTVAENILIAKPDASEDEMFRAAERAGLHELVKDLPEGYHTVVGEEGRRFSGGQAQRIALARAFLKDTPVLILDEPTSHLDPRSDREIMDSIEELCKGKTVLLIAHRLTSVIDADIILFMDKGYVAEQGTHEELLQRNGAYASLFTVFEGRAV